MEMPLALWIDLTIPKRRQLEIYLNVAGGVRMENSALKRRRRASGKPAGVLSAAEAALLAATLPNPVRRNARQPSPALRRLAATYATRAVSETDIDRCVRVAR